MSTPRFDPEATRRAALEQLAAALTAAGVPEPRADAGILVEDAAGLDRSALLRLGHVPLGREAADRLNAWVVRRLDGEPVFRIVGRREFWGLDLQVTPAVLDPRSDTEAVVRACLKALGPRQGWPLRLLDLGVGSGALLCALLGESKLAHGVGVDRSPEACVVARRNLEACGLASRGAVLEGHWWDRVSGQFDLVVSNPPYIETGAIAGLAREVRDHDPRLALDGGLDGLDAYRAIIPPLPARLNPDGLAVLEVGAGQANAVSELLRNAGLDVIGTERDLGGHQRAVMARTRYR